MHLLGDPLTTCPIQLGWRLNIEQSVSRQFVFIDNPERYIGNGSAWTQTRTLSNSLQPLLTLGPVYRNM
jgi:hypothetical protein